MATCSEMRNVCLSDLYYYDGTAATTAPGGQVFPSYAQSWTTTTASCDSTVAWATPNSSATWDTVTTASETWSSDYYYDGYGGHQRIWVRDGENIDEVEILRRMAGQSIRQRQGIYEQELRMRLAQVQYDPDVVPFQSTEYAEAEKKALKLLGEIIGESELEVYKKTGRLFVKGKDGDYIARNGRSLQKIEGNKVVDLCVHIESRLNCPPTDTVIGLKFLLENEPENVIRIANKLGESKLDEIPLAACM